MRAGARRGPEREIASPSDPRLFDSRRRSSDGWSIAGESGSPSRARMKVPTKPPTRTPYTPSGFPVCLPRLQVRGLQRDYRQSNVFNESW